MERQLRRQEWRKEKAMRERIALQTALRAKFIEVLIRCCGSSALWLGDSYLAGEMKYRVIHRHIGFDFVDDDLLLVRRSPLRPASIEVGTNTPPAFS